MEHPQRSTPLQNPPQHWSLSMHPSPSGKHAWTHFIVVQSMCSDAFMHALGTPLQVVTVLQTTPEGQQPSGAPPLAGQ